MQRRSKVGLLGFLAVSVAVGALVVRAQNQAANPYRARVKARFEALAQQANLSDAQKKSIAALARQAMLQGQAIAQNNQLPNGQKQQKIKALRESTRVKMAALLTPAQRQNLQKLLASRQQPLQSVWEEVADDLQLTDEQRAEVKPIIEDALQKGHAIWADGSTLGQKRSSLVQLHAATREKLASILSPAQMQKLDQMRDAVRAEATTHFIQLRRWGAS